MTVTSPGTLELNRPDDFTFSNAFSGTGTIAKGGANTVTIPAAVNFGGSVSLNAGTLRLNAGGTLSGALSGPGALTTTATLQLSGASANSNTGLTTVSGGVLQLNKTAGVDAVGGNITITGTAQLALQAAEQIPNTATLTLLGSPTRYYQGVIGIDTANFDDSATGVTNVNLTTTLSPNGVVVDNNSVNYTFSGAGRISGTTALSKTGTGTLTIANTGNNDYTGGTTIGIGSILKLGNGVTNGAGSVGGTIGNDGTLVLNRPDDVSFTNALTGSGTLQKDQANTASFTAATTLFTPVVLNAGTLKFNAGGTLGGDISGPGQLEAGGGTLQINGANAKTNTGTPRIARGR